MKGQTDRDPFAAPNISRGWFHFLLTRKSFIVLGALFGLAHSASYAVFKQPVYESTGQFRIVNAAAPRADRGPNREETIDASTHIAFMRTTRFIDQAIEKANLRQLKSFLGKDANSTILKQLEITFATNGVRGVRDEASSAIVTNYRGPIAEDCKEILEGIHGSLQDLLDKGGKGHKMVNVSPPEIGSKITPIAYLNLTVGFLFGLLIGVVLAFLADWLDFGPRRPLRSLSQRSLQGVDHVC